MEPRTLGDGIDNLVLKNTEAMLKQNFRTHSFQPIEPTSKIFPLKPVYVSKERKTGFLRKAKEPKFVPYEPYKAAVHPILPQKLSKRNNVEIQELVSQMSGLRHAELSTEEEHVEEQWKGERERYENDIRNLRESNAHLENQVKFQTQVNSELKTLLVAAVGEDLESRVQHLTEDKLQLARALLNSANHLTSHQERMEWLSGQCEVWRSKFLASSLMVEELARWKSALGGRVNELQTILLRLLDEQSKTQKKFVKATSILQETAHSLTGKYEPIRGAHLLELAGATESLSAQISGALNVDENRELLDEYLKLPQKSFVQVTAQKLLQNPVKISPNHDEVCKALISVNPSSFQMQSCCGHCKGEITTI